MRTSSGKSLYWEGDDKGSKIGNESSESDLIVNKVTGVAARGVDDQLSVGEGGRGGERG